MTAPAQPIRLFSTDLDGTLLGNLEATARFKSAWNALTPEARPLLVYNSGRLVNDLRRFVDQGVLPSGDFWIGGVGTELFDVREGRKLHELDQHLAEGWDRAKVEKIVSQFPGARPQPEEFQNEFKCSWYLHNASRTALRELRRQLEEAGVLAKVVYSSSRDLDVLPRNATKGGALKWLCERLDLPLTQVLVAGDTGNDASMFRLPGVRGIVVENAFPELYEATLEMSAFSSRRILADGVLDGLCHFGIVCVVPTPEETRISREEMAPGY